MSIQTIKKLPIDKLSQEITTHLNQSGKFSGRVVPKYTKIEHACSLGMERFYEIQERSGFLGLKHRLIAYIRDEDERVGFRLFDESARATVEEILRPYNPNETRIESKLSN